MATNGYTIPIFSKDANGKITSLINPKNIDVVNQVLAKNLTEPRYQSHLDHLMLFSTTFMNMEKRIWFHCIYVISLTKIEHKLFLKDSVINKMIESSNNDINKAGVYSVYPSFRFDNRHQGAFFSLSAENEIVIHVPKTNSDGLVRTC
jgi:hypothetical protein